MDPVTVITASIETYEAIKKIEKLFEKKDNVSQKILEKLDQIQWQLSQVQSDINEIKTEITSLNRIISEGFDILITKEVETSISKIIIKIYNNELDSTLIQETLVLIRWLSNYVNRLTPYIAPVNFELSLALKIIKKTAPDIYQSQFSPITEYIYKTLYLDSVNYFRECETAKAKAISHANSVQSTFLDERKILSLFSDFSFDNNTLTIIERPISEFRITPPGFSPGQGSEIGIDLHLTRRTRETQILQAQLKSKIISNILAAQENFSKGTICRNLAIGFQ